jgi:hypothetical protein
MGPVPEVGERVSVGDSGFIVIRDACGSTLLRLRYGKFHFNFCYFPSRATMFECSSETHVA